MSIRDEDVGFGAIVSIAGCIFAIPATFIPMLKYIFPVFPLILVGRLVWIFVRDEERFLDWCAYLLSLIPVTIWRCFLLIGRFNMYLNRMFGTRD